MKNSKLLILMTILISSLIYAQSKNKLINRFNDLGSKNKVANYIYIDFKINNKGTLEFFGKEATTYDLNLKPGSLFEFNIKDIDIKKVKMSYYNDSKTGKRILIFLNKKINDKKNPNQYTDVLQLDLTMKENKADKFYDILKKLHSKF